MRDVVVVNSSIVLLLGIETVVRKPDLHPDQLAVRNVQGIQSIKERLLARWRKAGAGQQPFYLRTDPYPSLRRSAISLCLSSLYHQMA